MPGNPRPLSPETPSVFVVDDDPWILRSLERTFRGTDYLLQSFDHPRRMLERAPCPGPACVVTDLRMPDLSGLELQTCLRLAGWKHPFVFISGHVDVTSAVRAMKEGAVDFLPKPFQTQDLLAAVAQALERDRAARAAEAEYARLQERFAALSPREWDVCRGVARGLLNKQIAAELGTAEQTVRLQRSRALAKLAVGSVAELVRLLERLEPRPTRHQ